MENSVHEQLLSKLDDLGEEEVKRFKFYLKSGPGGNFKTIKWGKLQKADKTDTVDLMVDAYTGDSAIEVADLILKKMTAAPDVESPSSHGAEATGGCCDVPTGPAGSKPCQTKDRAPMNEGGQQEKVIVLIVPQVISQESDLPEHRSPTRTTGGAVAQPSGKELRAVPDVGSPSSHGAEATGGCSDVPTGPAGSKPRQTKDRAPMNEGGPDIKVIVLNVPHQNDLTCIIQQLIAHHEKVGGVPILLCGVENTWDYSGRDLAVAFIAAAVLFSITGVTRLLHSKKRSKKKRRETTGETEWLEPETTGTLTDKSTIDLTRAEVSACGSRTTLI